MSSLSPSVEAVQRGREPSQAKRATCETRRGGNSRVRRASAVQCVPETRSNSLSRYQEPHLHEGAVFVILCETMEDCTMEKKVQLPKEAQPWTEVEVLFIDGCKVTVRYSRQKNPSAVKVIKETLLVSGTTRKI